MKAPRNVKLTPAAAEQLYQTLEHSHRHTAGMPFCVTNYMAFSKKTPIELVEKLQLTYRYLKKEGQISLE